MPWELPELLGPDLAREGLEQLDPINHIACTLAPDPVQPFARVATLEASLYMRNQLLRDTDWASMAHSLEVRVPLVDAELLRTCRARHVRCGRGNWQGVAGVKSTRRSVGAPSNAEQDRLRHANRLVAKE